MLSDYKFLMVFVSALSQIPKVAVKLGGQLLKFEDAWLNFLDLNHPCLQVLHRVLVLRDSAQQLLTLSIRILTAG